MLVRKAKPSTHISGENVHYFIVEGDQRNYHKHQHVHHHASELDDVDPEDRWIYKEVRCLRYLVEKPAETWKYDRLKEGDIAEIEDTLNLGSIRIVVYHLDRLGGHGEITEEWKAYQTLHIVRIVDKRTEGPATRLCVQYTGRDAKQVSSPPHSVYSASPCLTMR